MSKSSPIPQPAGLNRREEFGGREGAEASRGGGPLLSFLHWVMSLPHLVLNGLAWRCVGGREGGG